MGAPVHRRKATGVSESLPRSLYGVIELGAAQRGAEELSHCYWSSLVSAAQPTVALPHAVINAGAIARFGSRTLLSRYPIRWWRAAAQQIIGSDKVLQAESTLPGEHVRPVGDRCFVVVDESADRILLCASCAGPATLYLHVSDQVLTFALTPARLQAARTLPADEDGIAEMVRFGANVDTRTVLRGVERIPIGHYVEIVGGEVRNARPYVCFRRKVDARLGMADAEAAIERRLTEVLAESPSASVLFSGGVDSTLLAQLLGDIQGPVRGHFLAIHENDPEQAVARQIANTLGLDLQEHRLTLSLDGLHRTVAAYASPTIDFSILPTYALGRATQDTDRGRPVVDGTAGDAWFGFGSLRQASTWARLSWLAPLAPSASRLYAHLVDRDQGGRLRALKAVARLSPTRSPALAYLSASPLAAQMLNYSPVQWLGVHERVLDRLWALTGGPLDDPFEAVLLADALFIAVAQFAAKTGQWDLETETVYPFFSPPVVDIARCIPQELLINRSATKPLLKRLVVARGVGSALVYRRKSGFQPPLQALLNQPAIRNEMESWMDQPNELDELFSESGRALVRRILGCGPVLQIQAIYPLWTLIVLRSWFEQLRAGSLSVF